MDKLDSANIKSQFELKKNYLFSEKENLYFCERLNHIAFINDENFKNSPSQIKKNFEDYVKNLIDISSKSKNKPTFLCFGNTNISNSFEILTKAKIPNINQPHSLFKIEDAEEFDSIVMEIIQERSIIQNYINGNEIFIIIDDLSQLNLSKLVRHMIVSRSRKIFFILLFDNKNNAVDINHQFLLSNCVLKFICDDKKLCKIQGRFDEILKEFN